MHVGVSAWKCGTGVGHTKLLAKLCSGLNKPNMQTVLPASYVATLLHDLPLGKLRGLGGKFGVVVQEQLGITTAGGRTAAGRGPTSCRRMRMHCTFCNATAQVCRDCSWSLDKPRSHQHQLCRRGC